MFTTCKLANNFWYKYASKLHDKQFIYIHNNTALDRVMFVVQRDTSGFDPNKGPAYEYDSLYLGKMLPTLLAAFWLDLETTFSQS